MKILLADDHPLFRDGLAHLLREYDPTMEIIETGSCLETLEAVEAHPDLTLALLDLQMPDGHGFTVLTTLVGHYPTVRVVMLSASEKPEQMLRALKAGAVGFIPKAIAPDVMFIALRLVLAGGVYIPPEVIRSPDGLTAPNSQVRDIELTPRQLEVLKFVVEGKTNKEIADELQVSDATVKAHVLTLFRALRVSNRIQAKRAMEMLDFEPPAISI